MREAEELVYASGDLDTPVQHDFVTLEDLLVVDLGVKPEVGAIFVTELYSHKTICMFTMLAKNAIQRFNLGPKKGDPEWRHDGFEDLRLVMGHIRAVQSSSVVVLSSHPFFHFK